MVSPLFSLTILIGCLKIQLHFFSYSPKGYVAFPLTPCVYPPDRRSSNAVSTTLISSHVLPFNHISWPLYWMDFHINWSWNCYFNLWYDTPCMHAYIHGYVVDSDQVRVYTVCSNPNQVKAKSKQWFKRSDGSVYKWLKLIMSPQKNGYIALYIQNINMIIATMFPILMLEWRSNPIRCVLGAL